jgi:apolipoprotein N-acyltransferase
VDSFGRVERWLEPFSMGAAARQINIPTARGDTFYTRNGEVFSIACAILALAALITRMLLKRRRVG